MIDKQGNKHDLLKYNYRCINNKLNHWGFKSKKDNFISIISDYDGKCLNLSNEGLSMQDCDKNNKYEDFTIKKGQICARYDNSNCIDNIFDILPVTLESGKYNNLECSSTFTKRGFKCCSNQDTKVEYVDEIGKYGVENAELCGIGYERCAFVAFDYPCCSSVNPEVTYTDELGSWGEEDDQWCSIGEPTYDTRVRIKNRKTQECLITNIHSDTSILLMGDCNHSTWIYDDEKLVLNATGKCLYAMYSQDPTMIDCNNPDGEINHHIHIKIVDNKYICLKYSVDPEICLNGTTKNSSGLKFETSKNEYSEWYNL